MAIDPDLVRALHLRAEDRRQAADDPAVPHHLFQASTISALMDARYDGHLTVGEVLAHGDLGLGTLAGLDGELVIIDGAARVARVDGTLTPVAPGTTTPFAVVTPFAPGPPVRLGPMDHHALLEELGALAPGAVTAVRIDGAFRRLRLRSVPRQQAPYPPLDEVVKAQAEWEAGAIHATLVGFGFPVEAVGVEVPGWHLHAAAADGSTGGHVLVADLEQGTAWLDACDEVHVELPPGVQLSTADARRREGIERAETRRGDP